MDEPMYVMTHEAAERYKAEFKRATEKWSGQKFQHFTSDTEEKRHLADVKKAQAEGAPF